VRGRVKILVYTGKKKNVNEGKVRLTKGDGSCSGEEDLEKKRGIDFAISKKEKEHAEYENTPVTKKNRKCAIPINKKVRP